MSQSVLTNISISTKKPTKIVALQMTPMAPRVLSPRRYAILPQTIPTGAAIKIRLSARIPTIETGNIARLIRLSLRPGCRSIFSSIYLRDADGRLLEVRPYFGKAVEQFVLQRQRGV